MNTVINYFERQTKFDFSKTVLNEKDIIYIQQS